MRQPVEVAIELTTQELLSQPCAEGFVEIDDIATIVTPQGVTVVANTDAIPPAADGADDSTEIELTAAEMDELLGSPWPLFWPSSAPSR